MGMPETYREQLAEIVEPTERPLVLESVSYVQGAEDVGQRLAKDRLGRLLTGTPDAHQMHTTDRLLAGTSLTGAPGTLAHTLRDALTDRGSSFLLLTDRRLLLVGGQLRPERILWHVDRSRVRRCARAPRMIQRARVEVAFDDGSQIVLVVGLFLRGAPARRVCQAFAG
ncbi:hypothetical protein [Cumulibacter manganitolerans]|uniref:hypothetical protein n=1 Tax=Cumulibacter manganitolerans TaxID=1884992 RepID=UPI0012953D37|nr:hypothetical protein [Cumulibacter manganitolerans]